MKNKKNIMFVIGYMGNGGAERVVSVLANDFVSRGHQVSILTILGDKVDYKLDSKIKYIPLNSKYKNKFMRVIERLIFIRKHIKLTKSEYIVSFLAQVNIYTIVARIFTKTKLIISERNDPYQDPNSKITRKIRDILYMCGDKFVFQTPDAQQYFNKYIKERSTIIANPLKNNLPNRFEGERKKVIVSAIRLDKQKNVPLLINAYSKLHDKYPNYRLRIYGDGPLRDELNEYVKVLGLENNIELCGYSENLHSEIVDASMFIIPSNYEGISNSMIEALALGIPLISTDHPIGGAKMFINTGKNGILIPVNDKEALYEAMCLLIENKELSDKFSEKSVDIRKELDAKNISNIWEEFIITNK